MCVRMGGARVVAARGLGVCSGVGPGEQRRAHAHVDGSGGVASDGPSGAWERAAEEREKEGRGREREERKKE